MNINGIDITWLGHATFLLGTPEGKRVLVDPWLKTSPVCPEAYHEVSADAILVTHGHNDHTNDLVDAAQRSEAPVVGIYELASFFGAKGVANAVGMGKGGTVFVEPANIHVSMTHALHSSSFQDEDGVHYMGEPAGFVVKFSNGTSIYIAGDTCLFSDMALIKKLYWPSVAILPIGDHFTMDPKAAALACELLGVDTVVPCHYGTFPVLTGTPEQLSAEIDGLGLSTKVVSLPIGDG